MPNRLFLAVRLPRDVAEDLEALVDPRREASPDVRWTAPEHWHLTLAFLGAVDDERADDLTQRLEVVAARNPGFDVTLDGAGCYPHPDAAKVIWLGVGAGADALEQLALRCRTAAQRSGIAVEGGRYEPHLTLARHNRGVLARRWLQVVDSFPAFSWHVSDFVLIDSELTRGGPRHRVTRRFDLIGQ